MPIPTLNAAGFLPPGIHDCTLDEIGAQFGQFQRTDRHPLLFARLRAFVREAQACGLIKWVLVDGSFVTAEHNPNDVDLILVVPASHDFAADLPLRQYHVVSRRSVFRHYRLEVLVAREDSEEYRRYLAFFRQIRFEPGEQKGILRLRL